mgnify:CR=1 FL=1
MNNNLKTCPINSISIYYVTAIYFHIPCSLIASFFLQDYISFILFFLFLFSFPQSQRNCLDKELMTGISSLSKVVQKSTNWKLMESHAWSRELFHSWWWVLSRSSTRWILDLGSPSSSWSWREEPLERSSMKVILFPCKYIEECLEDTSRSWPAEIIRRWRHRLLREYVQRNEGRSEPAVIG